MSLARTSLRAAAASLILGSLAIVPGANAATAPSCVSAGTSSINWGYNKIWATNNCKSGQYVKLIIAYNTDVACSYYEPGQTKSYTYSKPSRLDRVDSC